MLINVNQVHAGCRASISRACLLGQCRVSMLPPTAITSLDSDGFWRATRPPGTSPLLVFLNSKSGDSQVTASRLGHLMILWLLIIVYWLECNSQTALHFLFDFCSRLSRLPASFWLHVKWSCHFQMSLADLFLFFLFLSVMFLLLAGLVDSSVCIWVHFGSVQFSVARHLLSCHQKRC